MRPYTDCEGKRTLENGVTLSMRNNEGACGHRSFNCDNWELLLLTSNNNNIININNRKGKASRTTKIKKRGISKTTKETKAKKKKKIESVKPSSMWLFLTPCRAFSVYTPDRKA